MDTKKLIIFGLIFFLMTLVVYLFILLWKEPGTSVPVLPTVTPRNGLIKPTLTIFPPQEKINIQDVEVNNFYSITKKVTADGIAVIFDNGQYQINYFGRGEYFQISVLQPPFEETREQAEYEFLTILGISRTQACRLPVNVSTPQFANPEQAGDTYPLSFCQ